MAVLTNTEIWAAADALEARGERASIRKVRAELGDRGNPGTIGKALRERPTAPLMLAPPPTIPEAVTKALTDWIGQTTKESANKALEALEGTKEDYDSVLMQVEELTAQVAAIQAEKEAAEKALNTAAGELGEVRKHVAVLTAERDEARNRVTELERSLADMESQIAAANTIRADMARLQKEYERLIALESTARTECAAESKRAEKAEEREAAAVKRAEDAQKRVEDERAKASAAEAKTLAAEEKAADAERRTKDAEQRAKDAVSKMEEAVKKMAQVQEAYVNPSAEGKAGAGVAKGAKRSSKKTSTRDVSADQSQDLFEQAQQE